jgi:hypothetical protein
MIDVRLHWEAGTPKENKMEEQPASARPLSSGQHYREVASKLREVARQCRFPGARQEILNLALRFERRADELDARNASTGSDPDPR